MEPLFMGIDVGTQGARVIITDAGGNPVAESNREFNRSTTSGSLPDGWFEQAPRHWWEAAREAIRQCVAGLNRQGRKAGEILALSVTSTSGTIVALDKNHEPLRDAIMYNDARSAQEATEANNAAGDFPAKLGYRFNASFGLPKVLWVKESQPEVYRKARIFVHASDYITGKISGDFSTTDFTNALKSGYDVADYQWPAFIERDLEIPLAKLPNVLAPGTPLGAVSLKCATETGLSVATRVVLGMTDGCASQLASGAINPGDWNTTIGTTLVIKGVTRSLVPDPKGRIYSHRHPDGYWMPGGASNIGGDCLEINFRREELPVLNREIAGKGPSGLIIYPLQKHEERFPIRKTGISGFVVGEPANRSELFQGYLEGVGFVEKLAYETLSGLGAEVGDRIFVAGGASKSLEWLKIRANILNKTLCKPSLTGAHMGMAMLAASRTHYRSLAEAVERMLKPERQVEPVPQNVELYQERYRLFLAELNQRGYL